MTMSTERELKFVADRETLRIALTIPLPGKINHGPVSQVIKTTYFDTEALDLMRHGVTLRVRQSGGGCTLGVKRHMHAPAGYFQREEDDTVQSTELNLDVLSRKTSLQLKKIAGKKALVPRFGSDVCRTVKT